MLSRTAILVLAGLLHASTNVVSSQQIAAYERVIKCQDDASLAIDKLAKKVEDDPNKSIKINCRYDKAVRSCLTEDFHSTAGYSDVLHFFRAYFWVRALVFNGCTDLDLGDLRGLVLESGILEREGLANIEEDPFSSCAQEANQKCFLFIEDIWETVWAEHVDQLSLYLILFDCLEKEAETCKDPMMEHIVDYVKAFKKHLWKHDAVLARMMSEDKQHEINL